MIELSGVDAWLWALLFYIIGLALGYLYGIAITCRKFADNTKNKNREWWKK